MLKAWNLDYVPIPDTPGRTGQVHIKQESPIIFGQKNDKSNMKSPLFSILVQNASSTEITSIMVDYSSTAEIYMMTSYGANGPDSNMYITYKDGPDNMLVRPFPQVYETSGEGLKFPLIIRGSISPGEYFIIICSMVDYTKMPADFTLSIKANGESIQRTNSASIQPTIQPTASKIIKSVKNKQWYIVAILLIVLGAGITYYYINKRTQKMSFYSRRHY
jgi:hypothetical protein